jgi:8-oxo-dGTP diphosphatase
VSGAASANGYAAVRAHVIRQGRVLLGQNGGRGLWTTFGGKPEPGECLEGTLARELHEELGIRPTAFARLADRARDWDGRPASVAVFAVTGWKGEPTNLAPHEHLSIRWFSATELASLPLQEAARQECMELLHAAKGAGSEHGGTGVSPDPFLPRGVGRAAAEAGGRRDGGAP